MKKTILVLVVALLLSLLSVGVNAQTMPTKTGREELPVRVNPLYQDVVDPTAFEPDTEPETEEKPLLSGEQPVFNNMRATYVSPETATTQLREYMKNRTELLDLYILSVEDDYEALINKILFDAMAHTGNPVEGDYLLGQLAAWAGGVEWTSEINWELGKEQRYYHFVLQLAYYTTAEQEQEMNAAVAQVLQSLNLDGKSDYEKVRAVYDYICDNVTYDEENLNNPDSWIQYTAYGALINKKAVCQGYSILLYRLLLELGIDNRIVIGEVEEGPHAWNIIRLGDVYYNADATWDAGNGRSYFLKNSEGFLDHYRAMDYCTPEFHRAYPMSETDYVDGVEGVPENVYVRGVCGEDAYWSIGWDGVLTIYGTGKMENLSANEAQLWDFWSDEIHTVVVEEGITALGQYAFSGLKNVTEVSLPESLEFIGYAAFKGCSVLREVYIPDGVVQVVAAVFEDCKSLESVRLSPKTTLIGTRAFSGCGALKQIDIPETVKDIEKLAFAYCDSLKEVTIPASVRVGGGFEYCSQLETVHVYAYNLYGGFKGCVNLRNVTLYDTVEIINAEAFQGCAALERITIPKSVKQVSTRSFKNCSALQEVIFTGDAPVFGVDVFDGVTATVYYPVQNKTWTDAVKQQYGGTITWVAGMPEEPEKPEEPTDVLGDVSGDGILDSYDATLILQFDVGMIPSDGLRLDLADVSGDGIVDSYDATLILQYDVGMITQFPAVA